MKINEKKYRQCTFFHYHDGAQGNNDMSNDQMKANRFARWATARKTIAWINARLAEGCTVCVTNHIKSLQYNKKHIGLFVATKNGAFVKHGKNIICIDGNKISAF